MRFVGIRLFHARRSSMDSLHLARQKRKPGNSINVNKGPFFKIEQMIKYSRIQAILKICSTGVVPFLADPKAK